LRVKVLIEIVGANMQTLSKGIVFLDRNMYSVLFIDWNAMQWAGQINTSVNLSFVDIHMKGFKIPCVFQARLLQLHAGEFACCRAAGPRGRKTSSAIGNRSRKT
jgi:hypothetical protein